jgi:hypothetical protein
MAFGASWSGRLIDANCYSQQKKVAACDASTSSTAFALDVSGHVYMLDANGNAKAASAIRNRADRAVDPNSPQSSQVLAKVDGTESGGTITVDNLEIP